MHVDCIFTGTPSALPTRRLLLFFVHFIHIFLLTVQITGKHTRTPSSNERNQSSCSLLRKTTFTLTRIDTCYSESGLRLIAVMLRCLSRSVVSDTLKNDNVTRWLNEKDETHVRCVLRWWIVFLFCGFKQISVVFSVGITSRLCVIWLCWRQNPVCWCL